MTRVEENIRCVLQLNHFPKIIEYNDEENVPRMIIYFSTDTILAIDIEHIRMNKHLLSMTVIK